MYYSVVMESVVMNFIEFTVTLFLNCELRPLCIKSDIFFENMIKLKYEKNLSSNRQGKMDTLIMEI